MKTTRSHWQMLKDRRRGRWKLHFMAAAVAALGLPPAQANPSGAQVVQGQAVLKQTGQLLTVTNSNGAIINWSQFNIAVGETTRFIQPTVSSQVLNRVLSGNPSQILGSLQSNGRVFLINPSGVVFGKGAQVDVGALVVSTLKLSDQDFTARRLEFGSLSEPGAGTQAIRNAGSIRTASGGFVYLVAPQVENSGLIHSPEGEVLLAAGHKVSLVNPRTPEVSWEVTAPDSHAVNLGDVVAKRIGLFGSQVTNAGRLQATTAVVGEDGRIVLKAQKRVEQTATGSLIAQGVDAQGRSQGGDIEVQAGEQVSLLGRIEAVGVPRPAGAAPATDLLASGSTGTVYAAVGAAASPLAGVSLVTASPAPSSAGRPGSPAPGEGAVNPTQEPQNLALSTAPTSAPAGASPSLAESGALPDGGDASAYALMNFAGAVPPPPSRPPAPARPAQRAAGRQRGHRRPGAGAGPRHHVGRRSAD
jgi:filamentous hemagglutinin family protein